ncbi:hypothetical protein GGF32_005867 [Allomyces javanicus]|nr:hypothetical protein GGF32_005867 [Allomyces javanicus]
MAFARASPRIYPHVINALIKSVIRPVYLIPCLPDVADGGRGRGDSHKAGDERKDAAKIHRANAFFVVQRKSQHEFQFVSASDAVGAVGIETELQAAVNSIMLDEASLCDQVQIYDEELSKLGPTGKNRRWSLIMQAETRGNGDVVVSDCDLIPVNKNKTRAVEYCTGPWALIPPNVKAVTVDLRGADAGFTLKATIQIVCHLPKEHLRSLGVGGELDTFSMVTLMRHLPANLTRLSFFGPSISWNVADAQKYAKYRPQNLHELALQDVDLSPGIMMILEYLKSTTLRSLSLRNARLKDKDLVLLKQHWPDGLEKLDVSGNALTDAGIITFTTGMPKSLTHLNIDHNMFVGDRTAKALTKSWPPALV